LRSYTLLSLLSLLLLACHTEDLDHELDVLFDPCEPVALIVAGDATAEELASIEGAADLWSAVASTRITQATEGPGIGLRFESAAPAFRGIYLDEDGDIVINSRLTDPRQRAVTLAHELGHAFGLWHVGDERSSVMNPGNLATVPNAGDAGELAAVWGPCAIGAVGDPGAVVQP
jgi:hypothetical protein